MNENEIGDAQDLYPFNFREISRDLHGAFESGGRLNKKDGLTRYGNSHVKDKTS